MEENKNIKDKLVEGIYIPSIEACWLYKLNMETNDYIVEEKYLDKLLNGKIDWSFELLEDKELIDNIEIKEYRGAIYTLDIVNVKYKSKYKKIENIKGQQKVTEEIGSKKLRNWTYTNGFIFNSKLMSNWKRGSGKARQGQNLFLIDSIKDKCLDWARMGLKFTDKVDIASIRAYESLPLSSIIGSIEINPHNILVIKDYESIFDWEMSKTWLEGKNLFTKTDVKKECNSIWDGQGLLSDKIFSENKIIAGKGVALLRNRFMKCASFNCNIEQFYRDYCYENELDYDTYEIKDMYDNRIKVKNIELITTPSSIKIEKFNKQVLEIDGYKGEGEGAWLKYWKDNCGEVFGVCKTEKPSYYCQKDENGNITKYINRLSYQMLNVIPFKKEEINELVQEEIKYIERLKNDLDFFLKEVKQFKEEETNEDSMDIDEDNDNILEIGKHIDVTGAFAKLIDKNTDFQNTQVFKDYRRNFINAYIKEIRQGKIRVECDYAVACGNPIEMLYSTVGEFTGDTLTLKDNELYCSRFLDGDDVIGFRNPNVNVGNVGIQVCREIASIKKYMNCTPNIVILNSINYPILSTYQGEDFDIDANLLISPQQKSIVDACKNRIDKNITPIPVNAIENTGKNNDYLTGDNMAKIDHTISQNYIGSVINLSQELNSLYNHLKYNNLATREVLNSIYNKTSRLSSISCVEIDKAKKQFNNLYIPLELENMKDGLEKIEDGRRVKPFFFKFIGDNETKKQRKKTLKKHRKELDKPIIEAYCKENGIDIKKVDKKDKKLADLLKANDKIQEEWANAIYKHMDTPMDWLQLELDKIKNSKKVGTMQVIQLVKKDKHKADDVVVNYIVNNIKYLDTQIKTHRLNSELNAKEKLKKIRAVKREGISNIRYMQEIGNMNKANMYAILKECLNTCKKNGKVDKKSSIESLALELLFATYGTGLLEMFG